MVKVTGVFFFLSFPNHPEFTRHKQQVGAKAKRTPEALWCLGCTGCALCPPTSYSYSIRASLTAQFQRSWANKGCHLILLGRTLRVEKGARGSPRNYLGEALRVMPARYRAQSVQRDGSSVVYVHVWSRGHELCPTPCAGGGHDVYV